MNFIKKNKIVLFVILALVILGGAAFAFFGQGSEETAGTDEIISDKPIKAIAAEEIGLKLSSRSDKKAVVMEVTKLDGVESIEYEVTYDAQVSADANSEDGGQSGITQRGVVGSPIPVKPGESTIRRTIELGTCSRNVCKYDNVVSDVKFVIKVSFTNGDVGAVEESFSL